MNQTYVVFWNRDEQVRFLTWWLSLKKNLGWRAELRRSETPADVLLCQGFRYLTYELGGYWTQEQNLLGLAAVAGVVAHIDVNNEKSFEECCATGDKPAVSELRFSQLQKSRTLDELYIRMIRTIRLLKKNVNPLSVADSILHWAKEMVNGEADADPRKRILVRWGLEYFKHLSQK
jgi:CRISPR system Cascade subunit CasB